MTEEAAIANVLVDPSHPLFVPLTYRLAGRIAHVEWEDLASDPATASHAVRQLQRVLGQSAVVSQLRLGFEAEACGADLQRGRDGSPQGLVSPVPPPADATVFLAARLVAHALDVTRRLSSELRGSSLVIGIVTGPRTLAPMFTDPNCLSGLYTALFRGYAEAGVAAVLAVESDVRSGTVAALGTLRSALNLSGYFGVPLGIVDASLSEQPSGWNWVFGSDAVLGIDQLELDPDGVGGQPRPTRSRPLVVTAAEVHPETPVEWLLAWRDHIESIKLTEG